MIQDLTFTPHVDSGHPSLVEGPGNRNYHISYKTGEKGRWLGDNLPAVPGETFTVSGKYAVSQNAVAQPMVIFWKAGAKWELHSTVSAPPRVEFSEDYYDFAMSFTVPDGCDSFRVELRAWMGHGTASFHSVQITDEEVDIPEVPDLPVRDLVGHVVGRMLMVQDVTDPSAELLPWPCYNVVGMAWGDDFFLTIIRPEDEDPDPDPDYIL